MRTVFLFTLVIFCSSCETSFTPNLPDNGSGVVVYSFFRPGTPLVVDVFNTTPILQQNKMLRKSDSEIRIIKNQQLAEVIRANPNGRYISTIQPQLADKFDIQVIDSEKTYSASSFIPQAVSITEGEFDDELVDVDVGKYGYPASFTFVDPPNDINYYSFEVIVEDCQGGCSGESVDGRVNELLIEEVKVNTSGNMDVEIGGGPERIDGLRYIYFNDDDLNGKTVTIKFYIIPVELDLSENRNVLVKYIFKSITKEYFDYLKTSDFQSKEANNFSEPVQIGSNISNGLGTFAGYNYYIHAITPE